MLNFSDLPIQIMEVSDKAVILVERSNEPDSLWYTHLETTGDIFHQVF